MCRKLTRSTSAWSSRGAQGELAGEGSDAFAGEEVHVAGDEEQCDTSEQGADDDRPDRVPQGVARDLCSAMAAAEMWPVTVAVVARQPSPYPVGSQP